MISEMISISETIIIDDGYLFLDIDPERGTCTVGMDSRDGDRSVRMTIAKERLQKFVFACALAGVKPRTVAGKRFSDE